MDEFLKKVEHVSNEQDQTLFLFKGAYWLTYRDGTASEAMKVTVFMQTFPTLKRIIRREYIVKTLCGWGTVVLHMPQIGAIEVWMQGRARGLPYMWLQKPQSL